ncbi:MAG: hypothetical protein EXS36_11140 [Pedosphaera sp.]|nr:hypothetical protein [Pedosphaera sp.]
MLASKAALYDQDTFFARYDGKGNVRWVQQIENTTNDPDSPKRIAVNVTSDNKRSYTNVFLSGRFSYSTTVGTVAFTNSAAQRMFISNWDVDGQLLWAC